jgi:hypothetical protein
LAVPSGHTTLQKLHFVKLNLVYEGPKGIFGVELAENLKRPPGAYLKRKGAKGESINHPRHCEDLHHHHHTREEGTRILKASTSFSIVIAINNVSTTDPLYLLVVIPDPSVDLLL